MEKNQLDTQFELSCSMIKMIPTRPEDKDLLYLYGMYKQAKCGDCDTPCPNYLDATNYVKWCEWNNNKGIKKSVAKAFYISKVDEIYTKERA